MRAARIIKDRFAISVVMAMATVLGLWAPPVAALQFGVVTAYTYSMPATSVPTVEGGASSTVPSQGFSSLDGAGSLSGFAAADLLELEANASSEAIATSLCQCVMQGAEVVMSAISQDVVTAGGGVPGQLGRLRLTLWLSGGSAAVLSGVAGSLPVSSRGFFSVLSFDPALTGEGVITTDPASSGIVGFDILESGSTNRPRAVDFPIRFEVPIGLRIKLIARAQGSVTQGSYQTVNGHTASFLTVQILDSVGLPVSNPSLTSQSGTPYVIVPEPTIDLGLAAAVLSLFVLWSRRGPTPGVRGRSNDQLPALLRR